MNPRLSRYVFLLVPFVLLVLYWISSRPGDGPAVTARRAAAHDDVRLARGCSDFQRTGNLSVPDGDHVRPATDAEKSAEESRCAGSAESAE